MRISGGWRADLAAVVRGIFAALLMVCFFGSANQTLIAGRAGHLWVAEWADGKVVLLRMDPAYLERVPSGIEIQSWSAPWNVIGSIQAISTRWQWMGFKVGSWPYASWVEIPFWGLAGISVALLVLFWWWTRRWLRRAAKR